MLYFMSLAGSRRNPPITRQFRGMMCRASIHPTRCANASVPRTAPTVNPQFGRKNAGMPYASLS